MALFRMEILIVSVLAGFVPASSASSESISERLDALERVLNTAMIVTLDECETLGAGWVAYPLAQGRFLLATGNGEGGSAGKQGGRSEFIVGIENMPSHRHTVTSSPPGTSIHNGFGGSNADYGLRPSHDPNVQPVQGWSRTQHPNFMGPSGGSEAIEFWPPFMTVNVCYNELYSGG